MIESIYRRRGTPVDGGWGDLYGVQFDATNSNEVVGSSVLAGDAKEGTDTITNHRVSAAAFAAGAMVEMARKGDVDIGDRFTSYVINT